MMRSLWRGLWLVMLAVAIAGGSARAQVPTTTVTDTVYRADGTPAGGTVLISWEAFTTAGGSAVAAGSTAVTIGAGGVLSVALAPNVGSTPMGTYYTAVLHLDDGTTSREYWVVPVAVPGGGPVKVGAIRNSVLPSSVAMQTVSKQYVDEAVSRAAFGFPQDTSAYVLKAGDTMTGPLVLPADPVTANQAADKNYVDTNVAAVTSGQAGKVSLLPAGTQVVSQPAGTQLEVNRENGSLQATTFAGPTTSGLQNALGATDCGAGCRVVAEATYPAGETVPTGLIPAQGQVVDERGGTNAQYVHDPVMTAGFNAAQVTSNVMTLPQTTFATEYPGQTLSATVQSLHMNALTGGSNQDPTGFEAAPYFKTTYGVQSMVGTYNTAGQHDQSGNEVHCYGVGDCIAWAALTVSSGGMRDPNDEGTHEADEQTTEDTQVFAGTCTSGCTTGSTRVTATATSGGGTQGEGRFLIDKNPSKDISMGSLLGGGSGVFATAKFAGTSFPVSVFLATAQVASSQPTNVAPGAVTLPIETSGVPAGFATNTAALPGTSGVACVADADSAVSHFSDYEMATYTVVDGSHLQLTLNKPHATGAVVAVGGLCGYGLEQTVDTYGPLRQVFPVVGSTSATQLLYADGYTDVIGTMGTTSGYANLSSTVAAIKRTGNVVTLTASAPFAKNVNGLTMTVSGVTDPSYNGTFTVTTTSNNTLTYADAGADSTSAGGTVSLLTGGYVLYPMAEVLNVYDAAAKSVDGVLTLAPNTVAWAAGDAVEEPHHPNINVTTYPEIVTQYLPRTADQTSYGGKTYEGELGPGMNGWRIWNGVPESNYFGAGGTHEAPGAAFGSKGVWAANFDVEAGVYAVLDVHCNLHGCGNWDSDYNVLQMDSVDDIDTLSFAPESDTATWTLRGTNYTFSPTSFTAGAINVGTLNATTITGGVAAGAITSGTIAAARLPVFGPSGTTHAIGAVPDPGATAGNTRYLREDGTWVVPASGGGSGAPVTNPGGGQNNYAPIASPTFTGTVTTACGTENGTVLAVNCSFDSTVNTTADSNSYVKNLGGTEYFNIQSGGLYAATAYINASHEWLFGLFGDTKLCSVDGPTGAKAFCVNPSAPTGAETIGPDGTVSFGVGARSGSAGNTDLAGTLVMAAGATTSASFAFAGSYASAPVCVVTAQSAAPATVAQLGALVVNASASGLSVASSAAASSAVTLGYVCVGRN